jgi:hypothetical protein
MRHPNIVATSQLYILASGLAIDFKLTEQRKVEISEITALIEE